MCTHARKWHLILLGGVMLLVAGISSHSAADQTVAIGGKVTATIVDQLTLEPVDVPGHVCVLTKDEGANASTGISTFMDGAVVSNTAFADLINGSGEMYGYLTHTLNNESVSIRWEAQQTMTGMTGATPGLTFDGTFSFVSGTGRSEDIEGGGTFTGEYISKTVWISDWEGEYTVTMAK